MGKTDLFTQFYPTGFTQWVKLTMPTLVCSFVKEYRIMDSFISNKGQSKSVRIHRETTTKL